MAVKSRSQIIMATDTVQLKAQFRDSSCAPADLDAFPTVSINQPSGNVALAPTSVGVTRLDTGLYSYEWSVACNPSLGVYSDIWEGTLNGIPIKGEFNFVVHNTQMPFVNTDGYIALGDDPGFCYNQQSLWNINRLLKWLRSRLDSRGKTEVVVNGQRFFVDCDIFTVEQLTNFLELSLSMFNQIPHDTAFTFDDTDFVTTYREVLVQGAAIYALSSKSLLERGREYNLNDNGVQFAPPTVSELMQSQYSAELQLHFEKIKYIKANMKPSPIGAGTLTISTSRHPAIARLRHLRARRIF